MERLRFLLFAVLLLAGMATAWAQSIVVQSFHFDEADLTANTAGTTVLDQNGQKCALLKVETTQTGFTFDTGMLGVVKTEQHPGEVWVYVPEGVKRITISHPQLGILRDHDLGQTLRRAKTYLMQLVTGEVQTTVRQARTSQFVVFQFTPQNAVVRLDGQLLSTTDGTAMKNMPFGTYDYMVEAPDYQSESGKVTVNDPRNKHVVNVRLKPNFSQVTLTVDRQAEIWVNGEKRGNGSWTGNLGAGVYLLEARLANHRTTSREVTIAVTDQPQTIRLDAPTPILGEASIVSTPAMADVAVDGKKVGQTPLVLSDLLVGQHTVKITKSGYADYEASLTVSEGQTADLSATLKKQETAAVPAISQKGTHAYVDLGLPSGTLWATMNIGASSPKDYGDYFAWGETSGYNSGKTDFSWSTYNWCNGSKTTLTKYNNNESYGKVDNTLSIDETDDVTAVKWGGNWHMPSASDFQELIDECVIEWTRSYNNTGYPGIIVFKCKDESDKGRAIEERDSLKLTSRYSLLEPHIFIPSAGYASDSSIVMSAVDNGYWTSDIDEDEPYKAKVLQFRYADINITADYRSKGYTIRPVTK